MVIAKPVNEEGRIAALEKYAILDTDPEQSFDDLTLLASFVCKTPTALISLIDEDRQWFKSRVGMDASETSREIAFCSARFCNPMSSSSPMRSWMSAFATIHLSFPTRTSASTPALL